MSDIYLSPRDRDVVVFKKGATITVNVTPESATQGWAGGQFFQWYPSTKDELLVTHSDGLYGGFALYGSDEVPDEFTGMTRNQPAYRFVVLCAGGWLVSTVTYERYTYASRTGPGPLVEIDYHASDRLVLSLNGKLTVEDEWTLSGDPRAPNNYYIAFVAQRPSASRNYYMTVQMSV